MPLGLRFSANRRRIWPDRAVIDNTINNSNKKERERRMIVCLWGTRLREELTLGTAGVDSGGIADAASIADADNVVIRKVEADCCLISSGRRLRFAFDGSCPLESISSTE
eukprot:IDg9822t1